jgi:hypothetical protein
MATFYVLPSRHLFGQRFAELFESLFPGVRYSPWDWPDLAETLAADVAGRGDVHVVYREDLDERVSLRDALMQHFGADLGDEIVEIQFGPGLNQFFHQQWSTEKRRAA